jgi:hypothetical protein
MPTSTPEEVTQMVSQRIYTEWLDGSSTQLREVLGELEGVSEETLERIDRVSLPSGDGPIPRFPQNVMLYERLVLLALAENALARQQAGATRARKASYPLVVGVWPTERTAGSFATASLFCSHHFPLVTRSSAPGRAGFQVQRARW